MLSTQFPRRGKATGSSGPEWGQQTPAGPDGTRPKRQDGKHQEHLGARRPQSPVPAFTLPPGIV